MFETLTRGTHRSVFHRWVAAAPFSILLSALLVGFGQAQTTYNEAPMLAERVAAGELPPIGERLPENPLVDSSPGVRTMAYENLMRWNPEGTEVIPNIAESVEVNEAGTTYTFKLREGMKWSDGQPFSADDIMFWYEDVFLNEDLTPARPSWLMSGEEPVVVEKVDDTTVTFRFAQPNGLFLTLLATPDGSAFGTGAGMTSLPRHYLERFHNKYNPDVGALVAEAGADDWVSLFQSGTSPTAPSRTSPSPGPPGMRATPPERNHPKHQKGRWNSTTGS